MIRDVTNVLIGLSDRAFVPRQRGLEALYDEERDKYHFVLAIDGPYTGRRSMTISGVKVREAGYDVGKWVFKKLSESALPASTGPQAEPLLSVLADLPTTDVAEPEPQRNHELTDCWCGKSHLRSPKRRI